MLYVERSVSTENVGRKTNAMYMTYMSERERETERWEKHSKQWPLPPTWNRLSAFVTQEADCSGMAREKASP